MTSERLEWPPLMGKGEKGRGLVGMELEEWRREREILVAAELEHAIWDVTDG